eukprot:6491958-Amphidinium_carterae.4
MTEFSCGEQTAKQSILYGSSYHDQQNTLKKGCNQVRTWIKPEDAKWVKSQRPIIVHSSWLQESPVQHHRGSLDGAVDGVVPMECKLAYGPWARPAAIQHGVKEPCNSHQ